MPEPDQLNPTATRVFGYGGVGINVWDYGGDGPVLILAHCTGTHGRVWDPMVPPLLPHFHVYSYDTRGHGDSDKPEGEGVYRWANSGADLLAIIDEMELGTGILGVGHSAGASHICFAEMTRPGLFSKAVLLDPIIGPKEAFSGPNALAEKSRRRRNVFESREIAVERFGSKLPMNAWDPATLEAYVRYGTVERAEGGVQLKCPGTIEAEIYDGSGAPEVFERLQDLGLEVTLVTAEHSNVRGLAEMQATLFPTVDFQVLPDCSHFIPQEKPQEIISIILNALS